MRQYQLILWFLTLLGGVAFNYSAVPLYSQVDWFKFVLIGLWDCPYGVKLGENYLRHRAFINSHNTIYMYIKEHIDVESERVFQAWYAPEFLILLLLICDSLPLRSCGRYLGGRAGVRTVILLRVLLDALTNGIGSKVYFCAFATLYILIFFWWWWHLPKLDNGLLVYYFPAASIAFTGSCDWDVLETFKCMGGLVIPQYGFWMLLYF